MFNRNIVKDVFLLLGSNVGERKALLAEAKALIVEMIGPVEKASSLYETEPWGNKDQELFINQVLLVRSSEKPDIILAKILQIELDLGRERIAKWGPRKIDIDIIYYGSEIIVSKQLKVPHPEMHKRNFTLVPLCEIAESFKHPVFNITSRELLERSEDNLKVYPVN